MHSFFRLSAILLAGAIAIAVPMPAKAQVAVGITVDIGPPAIPVYTQPPCPEPNYLWTPGYWGWGAGGYYWVPGTWVRPARVGYYWTPGYWGFNSGYYAWHQGYWGPRVGFYGGINYGFGYFGLGYVGGAWAGSTFRYNTAVTAVNRTIIRNVYVDRTVIHNRYYGPPRVSYFGGPHGVQRAPTRDELVAARAPHIAPHSEQVAHERMAAQDRAALSTVNRGTPPRPAVQRAFTPQRSAGFTPLRASDRGPAVQRHVIAPHSAPMHAAPPARH